MKQNRMQKLFFLSLLLILGVAIDSKAAVIFEDNFDNNCTGSQCNSCGLTSDYPVGWDQWMVEGSCSATASGTTHYSGEILSPGRGDVGKDLKLWRNESYWEGYDGGLVKYFSAGIRDIYFRYYIKIPVTFNPGSDYMKWFRFNTSGNTFYFGCNHGGRDTCNIEGGEQGYPVILMSNADVKDYLWDGNWHAVQLHINTQSNLVELWVDGTQYYSSTEGNFALTPDSTFDFIQHFPLGNVASDYQWANSWQVLEVDDVVFATTKAETDPIGGSSDTLPPTIPSGLSVM